MKIGTVTGNLSLRKSAPQMENQLLKTVRVGLEELVTIDRVGANIGDEVLLLTGRSAAFIDPGAAVDAVILGTVE